MAELAMAAHFRDALPDDAAVLAHHRFDAAAGGEAERAAYAGWVARRVETGTYIGRLAQVGGVVVAGAGVVLLDWGPTRGDVGGVVGRVVAAYTAPAWRRRGLAGALVREAMARAAKEMPAPPVAPRIDPTLYGLPMNSATPSSPRGAYVTPRYIGPSPVSAPR